LVALRAAVTSAIHAVRADYVNRIDSEQNVLPMVNGIEADTKIGIAAAGTRKRWPQRNHEELVALRASFAAATPYARASLRAWPGH
jgi:hypothetical protein